MVLGPWAFVQGIDLGCNKLVEHKISCLLYGKIRVLEFSKNVILAIQVNKWNLIETYALGVVGSASCGLR